MPKSRDTQESGFKLPSVDDLFNTPGMRADESNTTSGIKDIPIAEIDDFPEHPFKVRNDDDMQKLVESVSEYGVLEPALVRPKSDGRYEMIAGHRRKMASELSGKQGIPCIIREITDDEATIIMVDSNLQREKILPSEKAFAYKMKLNAMKRQAGRPSKNNSVPLAQNFGGKTSREILGEQAGESQDQIRRYIRLTELIPELLNLVDEERIKMRPAVELSYLPKEEQRFVLEAIQTYDCTPSHAQTILMRKKSESGDLDADAVEDIMSEEKPNQKERITLNSDRVKKYLPKKIAVAETEDYIVKALQFYGKYMEKQAAKEQQRDI